MRKNVTAVSDGRGLVIEKSVLELLNITPETELEVTTDGTRLIVEPVRVAEAEGRRETEKEGAHEEEETAERTSAAERARAEERLRESEERYRTLFDSIDEGFCLLERVGGEPVDFRYLEANPAFAQQIGVSGVVGKTIREAFPGAPEGGYELYERVWQTGEPVRTQLDLPGIGHVIELYAFRVEGGAGRRIAVIFQDITERKRAETNLAFSAEVSQDLVRLTNIDETMGALGAKIGRFFGVKQCMFAEHADEFETSIVSYGWNAEDAPSLRGTYRTRDFLSDELMAALMTGEPLIVGETQRDARVSAESYVALGIRSFIIVPLVREREWRFQICVIDDQPREWRDDEVELMRELTARIWARLERARAEERLRQSEERLRSLMENLPGAAVFVVDRELRYLVAEGDALGAAGFAARDLVGRTPAEALPPEPARLAEALYCRALAGEEFEHEHAAHGRTFISRGVPLADEGGKVYAALAVSYDITERKALERALQSAHDELEEKVSERTAELQQMTGVLLGEVKERAAAERRVRELLRSMVTVQEDERRRVARELHDTLGQQLTALRLAIDALKAKTVDGAHEEAERVRRIFERLDADVDFLAWELRPAALDHLGLDAALKSFVGEWGKHFGVDVDYHGLDGGAPPLRLSAEVETNLYRILQEALQNVHKHAGADRVNVILERRGGALALIVEDDGRGFDADGEEGAATGGGAGGTNKGMGVVNMSERATLLGGTLEVESAPGAGTTIFVRVPLKAEPPERREAGP